MPPHGNLGHRTRWDARQHFEHRHHVARNGDEGWESISKSALTQKHMQECIGFFVRVWSVIVPPIWGWAMPKVVLSEPLIINWSSQKMNSV